MEKEKFKLLYGDWKPQCSTIDVEGNHCPEPVKKYIEFDEHRAIPICEKCLEALNRQSDSKRAPDEVPHICGVSISDLTEILKSDSVHTLLRYGVKSPSRSGMDDCDDDMYYELYNLVRELRK